MQYVPCGKCGNCVKRYISDLTIRLKIQQNDKAIKQSFFITLTYEKDPLQLYKSDLQNFFKRLRKAGNCFTYVGVGDYGDTFGRPHYHVILFTRKVLNTDYIPIIWKLGDQSRIRGFTHVLPLTYGRISYVATYITLAKLEWDKTDIRQKPFFLFSRRPAIGANYKTESNKRFHNIEGRAYYRDGKFKKPLPRYYHQAFTSRHSRAVSKAKRADALVQKNEREITRLKNFTDRPFEYYYEKERAAADNYLEQLKTKKQLKNKLL